MKIIVVAALNPTYVMCSVVVGGVCYLLHTGLQEVSQMLHQLCEGGPLQRLPQPAVQHGLVSEERDLASLKYA